MLLKRNDVIYLGIIIDPCCCDQNTDIIRFDYKPRDLTSLVYRLASAILLLV